MGQINHWGRFLKVHESKFRKQKLLKGANVSLGNVPKETFPNKRKDEKVWQNIQKKSKQE